MISLDILYPLGVDFVSKQFLDIKINNREMHIFRDSSSGTLMTRLSLGYANILSKARCVASGVQGKSNREQF